jgi:hypothetical protein
MMSNAPRLSNTSNQLGGTYAAHFDGSKPSSHGFDFGTIGDADAR